jgi:hypothetical protein
MTDQQRTRSDKNKLQAPRAQLHSVSEREEAAGFAFASQIQRSPLPHPTSPNNPFFSLGVKLHRPENPTDDIETSDTEDAHKRKPTGPKSVRKSSSFTPAPPAAEISTSALLSSAKQPNEQRSPLATTSLSPNSKPTTTLTESGKLTEQHNPRERELELAAFADKNERSQLIHSRAVGSQDSDRSTDGPITKFLPTTKEGYLRNAFIKPDSEGDSEFLSQSHASGGSASQSTYIPSQNSDVQNIADPNRQYNFRQRGPQNESTIRHQFIRKNIQEQCRRCGAIHFYIDEYCTATVDINGSSIMEHLSEDTIEHRVQAKALFSLNEPDFELPRPGKIVPPQIAQQDMALFAEFLKFKAAHVQAIQYIQIPRSSPAIIPPSIENISDDDVQSQTSSRQSNPSAPDMASVIASAISQTMAHTPSALDIATAMASALSKASHNMTTNDPPKITKILDSIHLMTVIWPAYQVYEHQAKKDQCRSLWDLYSHDQKTDILEFFQEPIIIIEDDSVTTLHRNENWFNNLSTPDFLTAMCKELGYSSCIATETALKEIKFPGPLSDLQSWVTFKASWILALKQMSSRSRVSEKNLSTIFKSSLPSNYWKTNYDQQDHRDWLSGYKWCVKQLSNKEFQSGYNIDAEQLLKAAGIKHSTEIEDLKKKIALLESAKNPSNQKKDDLVKIEGKQKHTEHIDEKTKPIKSDNKSWEVQGNVNPKWDPNNQRDDNPDKKPCSICTAIHKYSDTLCTAAKVKGTTTDTPRLDPAILHQRKWDKQELGHYCTKLVSNPATSEKLSIEAHHGKAANTATTLGGGAAKKK